MDMKILVEKDKFDVNFNKHEQIVAASMNSN